MPSIFGFRGSGNIFVLFLIKNKKQKLELLVVLGRKDGYEKDWAFWISKGRNFLSLL